MDIFVREIKLITEPTITIEHDYYVATEQLAWIYPCLSIHRYGRETSFLEALKIATILGSIYRMEFLVTRFPRIAFIYRFECPTIRNREKQRARFEKNY